MLASLIPGDIVKAETIRAAAAASAPLQATDTTKKVFSFVPGYQHTLSDAHVDPSFCDSSSPISLSGYMDITGSIYDENGEDKHLFFWFIEKRTESQLPINSDNESGQTMDPPPTSETPLIVWLTGGPGCSSSLALLYENGPCKVNPQGDGTEVNAYGWTESSHVLWLDQPAGVGFSYGTEDDTNENMVGEDAYYFLQAFFQTHPEYLDCPLYIVGESYGGHYAPAIAHRVWVGNREGKDGTVGLNLKGLGVGNGLTDPEVQYAYYPDMAYNNSHNIKTVSLETYESMKEAVPSCITKIRACNKNKGTVRQLFACQVAYQYCSAYLTAPYYQTGLNPYDIRLPCGNNGLCYDFTNIETFMNLQSTRDALHVTDDSARWVECNNDVHVHMLNDWMQGQAHNVADLLNDGIPVLIYAGDVDFICNYMGNSAWTLALDWEGKDEFNAAGEHDWKGNGLARSAKGLTFLQVYDAGHMVPADKPDVALDMITAFMKGESF